MDKILGPSPEPDRSCSRSASALKVPSIMSRPTTWHVSDSDYVASQVRVCFFFRPIHRFGGSTSVPIVVIRPLPFGGLSLAFLLRQLRVPHVIIHLTKTFPCKVNLDLLLQTVKGSSSARIHFRLGSGRSCGGSSRSSATAASLLDSRSCQHESKANQSPSSRHDHLVCALHELGGTSVSRECTENGHAQRRRTTAKENPMCKRSRATRGEIGPWS